MKKANVKNTLGRQKGEGMLSVSIGLIVMAIIAAGLYATFGQDQTKEASATAAKNIVIIAGNIRKNFGANNKYPEVTTAVLVQSKTIPENYRITGTNTAQNDFGGLITGAPVTLTQANDAIALSWANTPPGNCADTVIAAEKQARRVTVGTTVVKPIDGQLDMSDLATACDVAAPVAVIFDIGRNAS